MCQEQAICCPYGVPSSTHQNFRQTYNPLFEGQTTGGQGREQLPFWPHQQNVQGNPLYPQMVAQQMPQSIDRV